MDPRHPQSADLHRLLARAGRALAGWDRRAAADHALTPAGLAALAHLQGTGPLPHRELAAALGIAPATLTPVVDALERAGDVVRARDETDRRVVLVAVTEAGRARGEQAGAAVAALAARVLPRPPEPDRAAVHRWLLAVLDALDRAALDPSPEPQGGPPPPPAGEVEPGGEGTHAPVELHHDRHLRDTRARVRQT